MTTETIDAQTQKPARSVHVNPAIIIVTRDLGDFKEFADNAAERFFRQDAAFGEGRPDKAVAMNDNRLEAMRQLALPPNADGIGRTGDLVVSGQTPEGRLVNLSTLFADLRAAVFTLSNAVVIARAEIRKNKDTGVAEPTGRVNFHARAVYASPDMVRRLLAHTDPSVRMLAREDKNLRASVERFFSQGTLPAVNCHMNPDGTGSVFVPRMHSTNLRESAKGRIRYRDGLLASELFNS